MASQLEPSQKTGGGGSRNTVHKVLRAAEISLELVEHRSIALALTSGDVIR